LYITDFDEMNIVLAEYSGSSRLYF